MPPPADRCPNCGAPLEASADGRRLGCAYCGRRRDIAIDPARLAAALRADHESVERLFDHLSKLLLEVVPDRTTLESRGGLFAKRRAHALVVTLERAVYRLCREKSAVVAERAMTVRGITLKTERLAADAWLEALSADLAELAGTSAAARTALSRISGGGSS